MGAILIDFAAHDSADIGDAAGNLGIAQATRAQGHHVTRKTGEAGRGCVIARATGSEIDAEVDDGKIVIFDEIDVGTGAGLPMLDIDGGQCLHAGEQAGSGGEDAGSHSCQVTGRTISDHAACLSVLRSGLSAADPA